MQTVSVLSPSTSEEVQQSSESDLELLSRSLSAALQEEPEKTSVVPPVPETLEELDAYYAPDHYAKLLY